MDYFMKLDKDAINKRLGCCSTRRLKWYITGYPGLVDKEFHVFASSKSAGYASCMFHSFSNTFDDKITLFDGQIHIAVGFCDLQMLGTCKINPNPTPNMSKAPLTFIGIDMSPYAVAKSSVIYEMLKDCEIGVESILEVWYSSTWTNGTLKDFKKAVTAAVEVCDDREIVSYLRYWHSSNGVTVKKARLGWLSNTNHISIPAVFKKIDDILDICEYLISGDVHARINAVTVCGNITMFDNIRSCPKRAREESVFHVLDMNNEEFAILWKKTRSLKECIIKILFNDIQKIKRNVESNRLEIQFICGELLLSNKSLISKLRAMKPYSVSWSNCIDFMDHKKFHKMARMIATQDCVHFAYSLNWVFAVHGTNIIDYPQLEVRKKIMQGSKEFIKACWNTTGLDQVMRYPPVANAINFGSAGLFATFGKDWLRFFLSPDVAGAYVNYDESYIRPTIYNPLLRACTCFSFCWTYDTAIKLLADMS